MHPLQPDPVRLRERTREPGPIDPGRAVPKSGLMLLRAIRSGAIPDFPTSRTLQFRIQRVRALTGKSVPVRAGGKMVASGRPMAPAASRRLDADGRPHSRGAPTFMLLDL
jgi:hypothetical protein